MPRDATEPALSPLQARLVTLEHADQRHRRREATTRLEVSAGARRGDEGADASHDPDRRLALRASIAMLAGDPDLAARLLSRIAKDGFRGADLWSDLAAAYIESWRETGEAATLVEGLAAAQQALALEPAHQPAQFNSALALSHLALAEPARRAWLTYLEGESAEPWTAEAERHLASLSRDVPASTSAARLRAFEAAVVAGRSDDIGDLVARWPERFDEHVEQQLLPAWASALRDGDAVSSANARVRIEAIKSAFRTLGANRWLAETVAHLDRLESTRAAELSILTRGLVAYGEASTLAANREFERAQTMFESAEEDFRAVDSPLHVLSSLRIAFCLYQRHEYEDAADQLGQLIDVSTHRDYRSVRGRALLLLGLVQLVQGDPAGVLVHLELALDVFETPADTVRSSKASTYLAYGFDYLGQPRNTWHWFHRALVSGGDVEAIDDRVVTLLIGSWAAMRQDEPRVALLIQEEVVRLALSTDDDYLIAVARRWRAEIFEALGAVAAAEDDLRAARARAVAIDQPGIALEVECSLLLLESRMLAATSGEQAMAKLDQAIEILRSTAYTYLLTRAFSERARLSMALGRFEQAEADLESAIAEVERQRRGINDPGDRITYFDRVREILDTMLELQLDVFDRPRRALELSERAKARALLDWLATDPRPLSATEELDALPDPLAMETYIDDLPESTWVVEYAVLPQRVVIWGLRSNGDLFTETTPVDASVLEGQIEALRAATMSDAQEEVEQLGAVLYDLLIRPIEGQMKAEEPIVFVPDGPLHALPFGLLLDRHSGRFLIQDRRSVVVPSARILASIRRYRTPVPDHGLRILFATAPELDSTILGLEPLRGGAAEATAPRDFPGSAVLTGHRATKDAFLSLAPDFEILHFGGHSIANREFPLLSTLHFAASDGAASGALYARDILNLRLPRAQLVVLASCGSETGRISRTEGVQSLTRPFLAIGVPAIIATLWQVPDGATTNFFSRFYEHLAITSNPADALRQTQLEWLDGRAVGVGFSTWAAFTFVGDAPPYRPPDVTPPDAEPSHRGSRPPE